MDNNQVQNPQDGVYVPKAIVVLSGGLDSTTALYWALKNYQVVGVITFDYDQRHKREIEYAKGTIERLNKSLNYVIEHRIQKIEIPAINSSLVNKEVEVPSGHYEEESMKATVVNNRNSIMFSFATAWAIDLKAEAIIAGIHAGDHAVYPDCRTDFILEFNKTMKLANRGFLSERFNVLAPFVDMSKADIAELGILLDIPLEKTYSDYEGGEVQRGRSGTSVERIEAISIALSRIRHLEEPFVLDHKDDPTEYTEKEYALDLLKSKRRSDRLIQLMNEIRASVFKNYFLSERKIEGQRLDKEVKDIKLKEDLDKRLEKMDRRKEEVNEKINEKIMESREKFQNNFTIQKEK